MNYRKLIMLVAITIMTMVSAICFADVPKDDFNIGGINPGQNMDYVIQVYGKPRDVDKQDGFQTYNYNDLFVVIGRLDGIYKVCSVAIYEKGLKTPGGFTVGMPFASVTKKYGEVKGEKFKGEGLESALKNCKEYTYFSEERQMVFIVDKKGVIRAIRVEDVDEEKYNKMAEKEERDAQNKEIGKQIEDEVKERVQDKIMDKIFNRLPF